MEFIKSLLNFICIHLNFKTTVKDLEHIGVIIKDNYEEKSGWKT